MIKEKIILYNDYSCINENCSGCKQFTHLIQDCPRLHFVPNKEKIIKKFNFSKDNERIPFARKIKQKTNALTFY